MENQMYNLVDLEDKIILENKTIKEIEAFLEDKDASEYILEEILN